MRLAFMSAAPALHAAQRPRFSSLRATERQRCAVERQVANPDAGRCKNGIAKRGRCHGRSDFAEPAWGVGALDDIHLDRRRFVEAQCAVVVEVRLFDSAILEGNAVMQRGTQAEDQAALHLRFQDRKSTRLNSSHSQISYAVFCLKKKK